MTDGLEFTAPLAILLGWLGGRWWGVLVIVAAVAVFYGGIPALFGWLGRWQDRQEAQEVKKFEGWVRAWQASRQQTETKP